MKVFSKRSGTGAAVLEAPEDTYASAPDAALPDNWVGRGPAPAGALHRTIAGGFPEDDFVPAREPGDSEAGYKPHLGSFRVRLRGGMPTSVAGRLTAGAIALAPLLIAAGAVLATRSYLLHDERFVIPASSQIQTTGNVHLTRAQLLSVFGEDVERNIFKIPLQTRREDLERLPWVEHATVMRLLPNNLRVAVTERTPVAFVRQGTHIGLVDASGVLLDMPENTAGDPHYSFPVLTGLSPDDAATSRAARMEIYRRFVKDLDGSGSNISDSLSEVDVSNPEDIKALIPSGGTDILVHFGDENFLDRYHHFEEHLPEWKTQYPKLASADMRYNQQVVLEMLPGAGVPLNAAGDPAADGTAADVGSKPGPATAAPKTSAHPVAAARPTVKSTAKPTAKPVAKPGAVATTEAAKKAKMAAALAAARQAKPGAGGAR